MIVKELIAKLAAMDPNAEVEIVVLSEYGVGKVYDVDDCEAGKVTIEVHHLDARD